MLIALIYIAYRAMVNFISANLKHPKHVPTGNFHSVFHTVEMSPGSLHWGIYLAVSCSQEQGRIQERSELLCLKDLFLFRLSKYKDVGNT